jgi:hypothetical protein
MKQKAFLLPLIMLFLAYLILAYAYLMQKGDLRSLEQQLNASQQELRNLTAGTSGPHEENCDSSSATPKPRKPGG